MQVDKVVGFSLAYSQEELISFRSGPPKASDDDSSLAVDNVGPALAPRGPGKAVVGAPITRLVDLDDITRSILAVVGAAERGDPESTRTADRNRLGLPGDLGADSIGGELGCWVARWNLHEGLGPADLHRGAAVGHRLANAHGGRVEAAMPEPAGLPPPRLSKAQESKRDQQEEHQSRKRTHLSRRMKLK